MLFLCTLHPHPESPTSAVGTVTAAVELHADALTIRYRLRAELSLLRVPDGRAPGQRRDGLWRHTCCELFVMGADGAYHEFNFSPSGDWQAYRFRAYREHGGTPPDDVPGIVVQRGPDLLVVEARVPRAALPAHPVKAAITAVIEDATGTLSYWALHHVPGKPDFHHPAGFTVDL